MTEIITKTRPEPAHQAPAGGKESPDAAALLERLREDGMAARVPGVPRVSSILRKTKPAFSPEQKKAGAVSMPRGTIIHGIVEQIILRGEPWVLPNDMYARIAKGLSKMRQRLGEQGYDMPDEGKVAAIIHGSVVSWLNWWRHVAAFYAGYSFAAELPLGSKEWPLRGTADLVAARLFWYKGDTRPRWDFAVMDWKSGKFPGGMYESYGPQLCAYKMMLARSLKGQGITDFTIDGRVVLLDPDGGPPRSASCHQRDIAVVRECHAWWTEQYENDPDFKRRFDYGNELDLSGN